MTCRVLYFTPSIKGKNPTYILEVFVELCIKSFTRSERCLPSYAHIELLRSRSRQELDDLFSCHIKNYKEYLKLLSGVSKSQVEELVVTTDQGKK